jgi:hypothetical protein
VGFAVSGAHAVRRTVLVILDAAAIERGPVAVIRMPRRHPQCTNVTANATTLLFAGSVRLSTVLAALSAIE